MDFYSLQGSFSTQEASGKSINREAASLGQEVLYAVSAGMDVGSAMIFTQTASMDWIPLDSDFNGFMLSPATVANAIKPLLKDNPNAAVEVAIISPSGTATYGFGSMWGAGTPAPDGNSLFEIGSITKTFTGTLLAQAVLEGRVALDAPAQIYMPAGIILPSEDGREITLYDMVTHTSGLASDIPGENPNSDVFFQQVNFFPTPEEYRYYINETSLDWAPGLYYQYSNIGASLVGHALETVYGTSYASLLQYEIFGPLGMTETTPFLTILPNQVVGYYGDTSVDWSNFNPPKDAILPAGGLRSSANDMLKYMAANLGLAETGLSPAMTLAQTPLLNVTKDYVPPNLGTSDPGMYFSIGYFWDTMQTDGLDILSHTGLTPGFSSNLILNTEHQTGVLILYNNSNHNQSASFSAANTLIESQVALDRYLGAMFAA